MRLFAIVSVSFVCLAGGVVGCESKSESPTQASAVAGKCEHGVQKELCTRCNPKLEAVFRQKGDWCEEHTRAESQCVICNPELAQQGIK